MSGPRAQVADEAERNATPRHTRGLAKRVFVSFAAIGSLLVFFAADHSLGSAAPLLALIALAIGYISTRELIQLFASAQIMISPALLQILVALLIASSWSTPVASAMGWTTRPDASTALAVTLVTFVCSLLVLFFASTHRYQHPGANLSVLSAEVLCLIYVGLLLAMTVQLRWVVSPQAGYLVLTSLIVATKGGDVGAYALGRLFGNAKMSPRLSPAKTWWGFRGAMLGSTLFCVLWLKLAPAWFDPSWSSVPLLWAAVYGLVLGLLGVIGDLFESLVKRDLGQKDSSQLMPGFGGVLDILDSVLYAAPVALLAWLYFPPINNWH